MLREIDHVRQVPNDYFRRLFTDKGFDLYIWYNPDRTFHGFQFCYELAQREKALTWTEDEGFSHHSVDTGEEDPRLNRSPMLVPDGDFDPAFVSARLRALDQNLPAPIRDFVRSKIESYRPKT